MANTDKIKVNDSLSSLDVEAAREPYRFALPGNKVITFPDPLEMDFNKAEDLVTGLNSPTTSISEAFGAWLSEEDLETLKSAGLNLRQVIALTRKVGSFYADVFGSPGNSDGSGAS